MAVALVSAKAEFGKGQPESALSPADALLLLLRRNYWFSGAIFLSLYFAINLLARRYDLEGYGTTAWSPDAGLGLLAILFVGETMAPFSFVGMVLCDAAIYGLPYGIYSSVLSALILTSGYVAIAFVLRRVCHFDVGRVRLRDVVALLTACPVGFALVSVLHCLALYLTGALPAEHISRVAWYFWIGETVGAIILIPAAMAAILFVSASHQHLGRSKLIDGFVFVVGLCLGFWVIFGVESDAQHQFFYLLFLPIIWIGLRQGYGGVAVALLFMHMMLVVMATFQSYTPEGFAGLQMFMLVLAATGLPLGVSISEGRRAAAALNHQQTESAWVSASAMGMALAHEISQPLSTVATYLHVASRMLQFRANSSAIADVLRKAESEAQRTREILERLRDFVSTGKMELKQVDLTKLVAKIVALCQPEATALGIEIRSHGVRGARRLPLVRADEIQIEQVLTNLVTNAMDAIVERRGGTGVIAMWMAQNGDRVTVNVEDNGCGVTAEMAHRLFEPYQTTKPKGMGLGLSLSRQIVEKHAGHLWWEPLVPEGTRFVLELKIAGPGQDGP